MSLISLKSYQFAFSRGKSYNYFNRVKNGWQGNTLAYRLKSEKEETTLRLGEVLGRLIQSPAVMILTGELGAGKTTLVRGLALGLEVRDDVSSPSFTLLNLYSGRMEVYHFDFYRLEEARELLDLDLEEYFYGPGLSLVEWGDKFPSLLPEEYLEIHLALSPESPRHRDITFHPRGEKAESLVRELKEHADFGD